MWTLYLTLQHTWTIGRVPVHTKQIKQQLGVGPGANTMEGRESKHVSLPRFAQNTQHSTQQVQIFRHDIISLSWLRGNGCDLVKHTLTKNKYIPAWCFTATFCHCGYQKPHGEAKCFFFQIYFTKTTLFTPLTLQQSIYSTLLNTIYSTLLKSLKYLHCFYLHIYLFIYLSIYYVFMHNKQTDKKQNKYQK